MRATKMNKTDFSKIYSIDSKSRFQRKMQRFLKSISSSERFGREVCVLIE